MNAINKWTASDEYEDHFHPETLGEYRKREGARLQKELDKIGYELAKNPLARFLMWFYPSLRCYRRRQ